MLCNVRILLVLSFSFFSGFSVAASDKKLETSIEALFDYRSDLLRENVNTDTTAIRNLSIRLSKDLDEKGFFLLEFLGDDDLSKNGVDFSLGELFYKNKFQTGIINSELKLGLFKLNYGVLNPIDDHFFILPSYYKLLYGLPRGIDTGVFVDNKLLDTKLYFSAGIYMGRALRAVDEQQKDTFGLPFSMHLKYKFSEESVLKIDYFIREYEDSPRVRGLGLAYVGELKVKEVTLSILSEIMNLNANSSGFDSSGEIYTFAPRLDYKGFYIRPIYSREIWKNSRSSSVSESYLSLRGGWDINQNFTFEVENLRIENDRNSVLKEDQLLARLYMKWDF